MKVHIVCKQQDDTRLLPRLARLLAEGTGWSLGRDVHAGADLNYLIPYLETCRSPFGGYFTHREDTLPNKVKVWQHRAQAASLRVVTARQYYDELVQYGPTALVKPPIDHDKFNLSLHDENAHVRRGLRAKYRVGVSGFVYAGGRKGDELLRAALTEQDYGMEWVGAGRGWCVPTRLYDWNEMEAFYHSLDLYVCVATIEGVPYPPLEALACGVPVVIPKGVGLLDDLPDVPGIVRYVAGDVASLRTAIWRGKAAATVATPATRERLSAAVAGYTAEAWVQGHVDAVQSLSPTAKPGSVVSLGTAKGERGVYVVAYGAPARKCAERLIHSIHTYMPGTPVAVASETELLAADVSVLAPDEDLGGRAAKTKMWDYAPKNWKQVLYLDADTELTADVSFLFDSLAAGWELVLTKDVGDYDEIWSLWRRDAQELQLGQAAIKSAKALQLAGGVVGFRRTPSVHKFLDLWYTEWKRMARRDQGALIRALYAQPVKVLVLGNEWNSFTGVFKGETAGILHHRGGPARRLKTWKKGRLDDKAAWTAALRGEHTPAANLPPGAVLSDYVGPLAIKKRGLALPGEEADIIASFVTEGASARADAKMTLYVMEKRPMRLVTGGFHVGCRECGTLLNYCTCGATGRRFGEA